MSSDQPLSRGNPAGSAPRPPPINATSSRKRTTRRLAWRSSKNFGAGSFLTRSSVRKCLGRRHGPTCPSSSPRDQSRPSSIAQTRSRGRRRTFTRRVLSHRSSGDQLEHPTTLASTRQALIASSCAYQMSTSFMTAPPGTPHPWLSSSSLMATSLRISLRRTTCCPATLGTSSNRRSGAGSLDRATSTKIT